MSELITNAAQTTLASPMLVSDTTLTVASGVGFHFIGRFRSTRFRLQDPSSPNTDPTQSIATPARVLRSCLIQLGLVLYPTDDLVTGIPPPCYVSSMPDTPDTAICVFNVGGKLFGRRPRTGFSDIHPGVRLVARTPDDTGWYLLQKIKDTMDTTFPIRTQLPEDGSVWTLQNIRCSTQIVSLGEEVGKRRQLWSITVNLVIQDGNPQLG